MSFFKKLFGIGDKKKEPVSGVNEDLPWLEPSENLWNIKLLDLRSTSSMLSFSSDPQMAKNAVSYNGDDGTAFWGIKPDVDISVSADLTIPIDGTLEPGVLFVPGTMEHKWAIFFDGIYLIFVRSWLRKVLVVAKTSQKNNLLIIENIIGQFTDNESPEFTRAVLNFLLIGYAIGENIPAPLPKSLELETKKAGAWAFSIYGNKAHFGTFDVGFLPITKGKLRSHSLLHIAVAKSNIDEIEKQIKNGIDINLLAGDGLATLHWSIADESTESMKKLLELGADPNIRTIQGATPLMNAVQSNKVNHVILLLQSGALINAKDYRGFTALHRAAEMGHLEILKILLSKGADKNIEAENHTALSLARARENKEIIELLTDTKQP